jgi:hypothetical protein
MENHHLKKQVEKLKEEWMRESMLFVIQYDRCSSLDEILDQFWMDLVRRRFICSWKETRENFLNRIHK